ncbi:PTS system, mannose-specific IID component [Liquorilactobacillus sucicola DSM 21376 = JCM 15457]|uniref:PTS system N-acetylgalactosamine-specific transporter subunit IID n=1 Tax=Liquorilactobacillus sucicola DSM 21376 = JCM 15457 TaxID=1423806 RepID=A0A023CYD9_9LACO|nr:PTS galactosamine transporter subunit IID [Liquorilactobacillus sucicola]KRN07033.1 PTS system N-acetylgalactosamine-specific transporter subunit IID [Liquorilactobacillus sucicola DSM 21376 = JCM 15457]GAJ26525.1 PTS system, mannose-specific IID component [Liquorilactobacillus sucicola DSM 21376 = JCM 15457]
MVSKKGKRNTLSTRDITKLGLLSLFNQAGMNYQRMQADGWALAMTPALKKIYAEDKTGLTNAIKANLQFINTNNYIAPLLMGLEVSLEENGEDRSTIDSLRVALFGPIAGIGDAITWFTILPIVAGITASFAKQGSIIGPLAFFVVYFAMFLARVPIAHLGYSAGTHAISKIHENSAIVAHAASVLGCTVIGGLIATYVQINVVTKIQVTASHSISIQKQFFDNIFPNILPLGYTFFLYWLLKKKNANPVTLIILTFLLSILLSWMGVL